MSAVVTVAILAICAQVVASAPVAYGAIRSDGSLAYVVAPQRDSTVRGDRVEVRVRLKPRVTAFSAHIGSTPVGRRFVRRAGGWLRVATLPVGRATGVRYGVNRLLVRARAGRRAGDLEAVRFAIVRRAGGLLRVRAPQRAAGTARVRLRLATGRATVSLRLNGRRVALPASAKRRTRVRTILLTGDEGLRHGRNLLRLTAVDRAGGRFSLRRRAIVMARTAPIPGAGRDRRALPRRRVVLDPRGTRAAYLPPSLRYRWRLVRKPRGSRVKLRMAGTQRPHFIPDRPGRYRLRMTVVERIPVRAPGRPARAAIAGAAARAAASDTTTISATPDGSGIGVPIDTRSGRQVTVGDQAYQPPDSTKSLQLVVLDRQTLELISNTSFSGDAAGTASLASAVAGLDRTVIAIIATRAQAGGAAPVSDGGALASLNRAVATLGGRAIPGAAARTAGSCFEPNPVCGGFSVIGTPGFALGEGAVNPGLGGLDYGDGAVGGALTGYLQLDQTGTLYTFVPSDHVAFDTTAAGTSPTQAVIEVGGSTYRSLQLEAPFSSGAYVLVLDAGSLALREQGTFPLGGGPDFDTLALSSMAQLLNKYAGDPSALVFTQSIGPLTRADRSAVQWTQVSLAEQALGSHRTYFNGLSNDSYARVAPGGGSSEDWAKVASQLASRTDGQLAGTLARNDSSQFYPANAAGTDDFGDELTLLAYQSPTPWPARDTPGRRAALRCIAGQLRLNYPVEDNYDNENLSSDWGNKQAALDGLSYSELSGRQGCDTQSFSAQDLADVTAQLDREFEDVPVVWTLIANLQKPFLLQGGSSELSLMQIADDVRSSLDPPQTSVGYDGLAISEELLYILGALPFVGEGADVIELIAAGIGLVDDTTLAPDGTPAIATISQTTVDNFGEQLANQYVVAAEHFEQIGEMLVQDPAKLDAAATNAVGPWAWTSARTQRATMGLGFAARRFAWTTLFPEAYDGMLRGTKGDSTLDIPDDTSQYTCWQYGRSDYHSFYPFKTQLGGGVTPVVSAGPEKENWVFSTPTQPNEGHSGEGNSIYDDFSATVAAAQPLREMFLDNAPEGPMPPLTRLAFALSIRQQLQVLTVYHVSGESANGDPQYNLCEGNLTAWPAGL